MKISKDKLKRIIKEELDKVMKEGVGHVFGMDYLSGRHKGLFDQAIQQLNKAKQSGEDFARVNISGMQFILKGGDEGATVQYVGSKPGIYVEGPKVPRFSIEAIDDKGDKFLAQLSAGKQEFYQDQAAAQNKQIQKIYEGGLEEIKGEKGRALSKFKGSWARTLGHQDTTGAGDVRSVIKNIRMANDERDEEEDDIYGPTVTKDEIIDDLLVNLEIDPQSKLAIDLRNALKAAAKENSVRNAEKVADILRGGTGEMHGDLLAQRKPANITQKAFAKKNLGIAENEEVQQESTEQQMEELSESFRRFTKLPKAVLKD